MTDQFFLYPKTLEHSHAGPLAVQIDSFAERLLNQGYAINTCKAKILLVADLSHWIERKQLQISNLDEKKICEFIKYRFIHYRPNRHENPTLRDFLAHLRGAGIVPVPAPAADNSPLGRIESNFARYLEQERGLSQTTIDNYIPIARRFLSERFGTHVILLEELNPPDITRFILHHAHIDSPSRAKLAVTVLRSFLSFLYQRGQISTDLSKFGPTVANWRLSELPKFLKPEEVERLLQGCDQSSPGGQRDYTILLLLARLGLRAGEVVHMELDDIFWETGEFIVRGKSARQDRLPLPQDVGEALATYLCHGRPRCSSRRVFIRMRAPLQGFSSSTAISDIVRRAFARAKLHRERKGAHLLRHSLATEMLRQGASLTEIGEILRHQLFQTTEIYAKVAVAELKSLAQPWIGG
jgi:site-specific recombinase XerD